MQQRIVKNFLYTKFSAPFPKARLGVFLASIFCSFLIVIATFTPVPLRILAFPDEALLNAVEFFSNLNSIDQITRVFNYIPQVPVVVMIASMLGPRAGIFSVFLYVIAGIAGFPVFASGGGIHYLLRIRFGYILGFFAGAFITGRFIAKKPTRLNVLKAAIAGVIAVHIIGAVYLVGMLLLEKESLYSIFGWILQLSGMQIVYDIFFSIIAAFLGRAFRRALWVVMD